MPVRNTLMFQYAVTSKVQISGKYSEYFFYYYLLMPSSSTAKRGLSLLSRPFVGSKPRKAIVAH